MTKLDNFYSSSKVEIVINEIDIDNAFQSRSSYIKLPKELDHSKKRIDQYSKY